MHQLEFDTLVREFLKNAKVEIRYSFDSEGIAIYSLVVMHKELTILRIPLWDGDVSDDLITSPEYPK